MPPRCRHDFLPDLTRHKGLLLEKKAHLPRPPFALSCYLASMAKSPLLYTETSCSFCYSAGLDGCRMMFDTSPRREEETITTIAKDKRCDVSQVKSRITLRGTYQKKNTKALYGQGATPFAFDRHCTSDGGHGHNLFLFYEQCTIRIAYLISHFATLLGSDLARRGGRDLLQTTPGPVFSPLNTLHVPNHRSNRRVRPCFSQIPQDDPRWCS